MNQRKAPSKRHSSYIPPTHITTLEQHVVELADKSTEQPDVFPRTRIKSYATPHFNALQTAVSKLARIDDFFLEKLGYGFFSDVFKVTHKLTGKVMALKRNKDTNTKLNILREVQLLNRLSHPNILKYMGVCVHEGQLHALTEFVNGGDLDQLIQNHDVILPWWQRICLSIDIASGIDYLHSKGIFHRDMTAKNCLIKVASSANNMKTYVGIVADLGLAEKIPTKLDMESKLSIVGSPYYMAPEVLCNRPYNNMADLFSFGIILCQLIARVSSEPEELPRTMDFGLAVDLFKRLAALNSGEIPVKYLQLACDCCQVDPAYRVKMPTILSELHKCLNICKKTVADHQHQSVSTDINGNSVPKNMNAKVKSKRKMSKASLHRSYSDITNEIISDNNQCNYMLQHAFINPFSTLEYLDVGVKKIVDKPSTELLEMTFDLPSPIHSNSTNQMRRKSAITPRSKQRPNSLFVEESDSVFIPATLSSPLSPQKSKNIFLNNRLTALKIENLPSQDDVDSARAHALLFSPHGGKYSAWWTSCQYNFMNNTNDPLSPVLIDIAKKFRKLRRSVSLPNLRQQNLLSKANHRNSVLLSDSVDLVCCTKCNVKHSFRSSHICNPSDTKQRTKTRSKTIDNVFHEIASLECLPEEVETRDYPKDDGTSDRSVSFSDEVSSISEEKASPTSGINPHTSDDDSQTASKSLNRFSRDSGFDDGLINRLTPPLCHSSSSTSSVLPEMLSSTDV